MVSLDIENLFTNIPVHETIKSIIEDIYNHPSIPPSIQPKVLEKKKLLFSCTTRVPLYDLSCNIDTQIDGISMRSSLDPTISEFYMSHFENKIFKTISKPKINVCYVDDIFIATHSYDEINIIKL